MPIQKIEAELKKVITMPKWGRKQSNDWDSATNFVYTCPSYSDFLDNLKGLGGSEAFSDYATHRWFNTWSAVGVEKIFCSNPNVIANTNKYDKLVDFKIKGINFDHKTSVFPKGFGKDLQYAKQNPEELIQWLYEQQSKEGRYHTDNRLFLVIHKNDGNHWELRKELSYLQPVINQYVANFNENNLHKFEFVKGKTTLSDIIWATN